MSVGSQRLAHLVNIDKRVVCPCVRFSEAGRRIGHSGRWQGQRRRLMRVFRRRLERGLQLLLIVGPRRHGRGCRLPESPRGVIGVRRDASFPCGRCPLRTRRTSTVGSRDERDAICGCLTTTVLVVASTIAESQGDNSRGTTTDTTYKLSMSGTGRTFSGSKLVATGGFITRIHQIGRTPNRGRTHANKR